MLGSGWDFQVHCQPYSWGCLVSSAGKSRDSSVSCPGSLVLPYFSFTPDPGFLSLQPPPLIDVTFVINICPREAHKSRGAFPTPTPGDCMLFLTFLPSSPELTGKALKRCVRTLGQPTDS